MPLQIVGGCSLWNAENECSVALARTRLARWAERQCKTIKGSVLSSAARAASGV
jgi:hypothetical protein